MPSEYLHTHYTNRQVLTEYITKRGDHSFNALTTLIRRALKNGICESKDLAAAYNGNLDQGLKVAICLWADGY